ncbi:Carbohydrate binding domain-containing protein [Draconibacterium orientale]|uniref:non-reducing end alpha-L-arabinofuranosidase n=1 Tax=Draconibacterium orientale TaxID=1168034 RepID=X5DWB6_9BACT|nr:alpha-L-arabinofuranosidase C-terminal domain-containing protein [Draconibacterium orientale]AHW59500.1 alpha-L-arabinofuranosidase [Draconibacterium orientale]SES89663.1 Carbohydrate binding domain-containing protein [Draconibacterium orientale]
MKINIITFFLLFLATVSLRANEPDSAYVFSYTCGNNNNTAGLNFAWSVDRENWHAIGPEFRFLASDFGSWGSQKKMFNPFLFQDNNGLWHCLWTLNDDIQQFAHAASTDLYNWKRQSYPEVVEAGNVANIEVAFDEQNKEYTITWMNENNGSEKIFKTTTNDFKTYSATEEATKADRLNLRETVLVDGEVQTGVINKLSWNEIDALIKWNEWSRFHEQQRADNTSLDAERFKNLKTVDAEISVLPENSKTISDMLIGIFFEDINYAADGGLYAELVQNRGFEYQLSDRKGSDMTWTAKKAWSLSDDEASFAIDTVAPIHKNNKHFAVLDIEKPGVALVNEGFNGISLKQGEKYNFSVFAKMLNGAKNNLRVALVDENGEVLTEVKTKAFSGNWKKLEAQLTATKTTAKAKLQVIPQEAGKVALDMISLFPENTFKNRKNGLRADLAQVIADMKPRFVRFPGGCVAHGDGLENIYHWNNTVGPLEARVPQRNIWNYHQTAGLGYYEYFQFCEDIDAEPVPVLAAGVPCQNSSCGGHGQQGGIPMCEMDAYVQEVLDLIEWANGDKNTKWGKIRAEAGHPEPFNLKYIGIGNEDLITDVFEERFTMIYNAVREQYPEITVIGTVGPFYTGTDYEEGWELATKLEVPMVDEHYYQPPGWFIHNQDYYDRYDRSKSKVYLGEYAAHLPGRPNNIETALSEALYLTAVERNADVVTMTTYAPLLAKEGFTQWNPDLIYFNNEEVHPTVGYYVQKLYGNNAGDSYIPSEVKLSDNSEAVRKRVAISVVKDSKTNDIIVKLVNLLPAEVAAKIDLSAFEVSDSEAVLSVLKGNPDSKTAKPDESIISVAEKFDYTLPAYSFSVIRIKNQ